MKFYTRYNPPPSPSVKFTLPTLADQSQKDECDVNRILQKFRETGSLVDPLHPGTRQPSFGDFYDLPDYQGMLDVIAAADDAFMTLPATVRDRFRNNPAEIFEFLKDEKNRDEAVKLGILPKPVVVVESTDENVIKSTEDAK